MTIKSLYPTVRPTLNLDFAKTKVLDPRITYTRASTATFVGSNGLIQSAASGAARFDHNPATGESLGFLVEEARTNLLTYSEQFDNAAWSKTGAAITPNTATAPDGTLTADSLIENSGAQSTVIISQSGGNIFASVFAKEIPGSAKRYLYIGLDQGSIGSNRWAYAIVDVATGSFVLNSNFIQHTVSNVSVVSFPNGWKRISGYFSSPLDAKRFVIGLSNATLPGNSNSSIPYTGDGTSGIYIWGAQLEVGSFPTSYIPTTTATVTRAADVASMTGANFSSWYNDAQGTIYGEWRIPALNKNVIATAAGFGSNGNNGFLRDPSSTTSVPKVKQALGLTNFSLGNLANPANQISAVNGAIGGLIGNVAAGTYPGDLQIGFQTGGTSYLNGTIARLAFYPVRFPEAQLQALTL